MLQTKNSSNILDSTETFLLHQCNCITKDSAGLAKQIFTKYPQANVYKDRTEKTRNRPGKTIFKPIEKERFVANAMAQYWPGKPNSLPAHNGFKETYELRRKWFEECLDEIACYAIRNPTLEKSIAVPYKIGCGLAGGNWKEYLYILYKFTAKYTDFKVVIYNLDDHPYLL